MMRPLAPWQILHVDLENLPDRLELKPDMNAAVIYFRLRGSVIGSTHELPCEFPMPHGEILWRASMAIGETMSLVEVTKFYPFRSGNYGDYWDKRWMPNSDTISDVAKMASQLRKPNDSVRASIVICTRKRPDELAGCLDSLKAEILAGRDIVVVDNGPDDETRTVVNNYPRVRYATAEKPGLSHARNVGLATASGDIVAFIDDDVRPEPGWIGPLANAFLEEEVDVVCGLVLPESLNTEAQIAFQYDLGFGGMGLIPLRFDKYFINWGIASPKVWTIGAGANMAVRRKKAIELGGFDERVGPGAAGGCGDDSEFWSRVLHSGGTCIYQPLSVVHHRHRPNLDALKKQAYGYGFGHIVGLFAQFGRNRDVRDLLRVAGGFPGYMTKRTVLAPFEAIRGRKDHLLWAWWKGYFSALRYLPLAFSKPTSQFDLPVVPTSNKIDEFRLN